MIITASVSHAAVALALSSLLAGCSGDDLRIFFGIAGEGGCSTVVVEFDADDGDSKIARHRSGSVDCVLDSLLEQAGCSMALSDFEDGTVRATISACSIPSAATLLSCSFEDADVEALQEAAFAQCGCQQPSCDASPPVCVGEDEDLSSCEAARCDNGSDDDGDGLVDCEDADCEDSPGCRSSATTTLPSLTTTTLLGGNLGYTVSFELESASTALGALQFSVDYSAEEGGFVGGGGSVACANRVAGALFAPNDDDEHEKLTLGFVALTPFDAPTVLAQCTFAGSVASPPGDFEVTVEDATDIDGAPATAAVSASSDVLTTTTTITSTTTLPADAYKLTLRLEEAGDSLGSLGLALGYAGAPGGFPGTGNGVECANLLDGVLFAVNDADAQRVVRFGWITLTPFSAPADLAECTFRGSVEPVPADFDVVINDASNGQLEPTTATVGVIVTPLP